jgi:1-deoxy-D-xylulose-5-phosphate synthase
MQPKDEEEFADMLRTMADHSGGPVAIRYPRGSGPGAVPKAEPVPLEIGRAEVLRDGGEIALFGLGNFCQVALDAADLLAARGIRASVINPRWIKPLDTGTLESFARGSRLICTLEDHAVSGGFGSAVAEHLSDRGITTPLVRVGWPDRFIEHGSVPILRMRHGMTAEAVAARILAALGVPEVPGSTPPGAA